MRSITTQTYEKALLGMAFINSPLNALPETSGGGEETRKHLQKILNVREAKLELSEEQKKEVYNLTEEVEQLLEFKGSVEETDAVAMKEIDDIVAKNSTIIQEKLIYNPELYFDIYFLMLSAKNRVDVPTQVHQANITNPSFQNWFYGSKVIEEGQPKIVYHGTRFGEREFTKFDFTRFPGAYFAENKLYSEWFAQEEHRTMYECYLRVLNPIDITGFKLGNILYDEFVMYFSLRYGIDLPHDERAKTATDRLGGVKAWQYFRNSPNWLTYLKDSGVYDGIKMWENNPSDLLASGEENSTIAWIVLKPEQIKTADGRNQTYSLLTQDIRYNKGGKLC